MTEKSLATDWDSYRVQFPVTQDFVYFNHAAIAPISLAVKEQMARCMQKYCEYGIVCNREFLDIVEETRVLAARLVHSEPSEIAFVKNTTQGLLLAAHGIDWNRGDNIVIPDKEFPANVFPWLALARKGVEVRFVPLRNGRFTVEDIAHLVDQSTKAVSVSAVSFVNGFRCNLQEIGQFCADKGIFFIVDAIQALGAVEVDVKECHVDFLSADSHKWLLGPQGIGIAYLSPRAISEFHVSNMGWKSMVDEADHLRYDIRLKPGAARFEEGTLNIFGIIGLESTLEMLSDIGLDAVQDRILELTDLLAARLEERGYEVRSPMKRSERSGILSFSHEEYSGEEIYHLLFDANVVCALRDGAVRISPHFYNNTKDIDNFIKALR
jgi:selenocysteine lyase/cysteine desulfurase